MQQKHERQIAELKKELDDAKSSVPVAPVSAGLSSAPPAANKNDERALEELNKKYN